jgi:hypothetical protein
MLDWLEIDSRVHELIKGNRLPEAEALLLKSYEELKETKHVEDLDYVIGSLAQFYSMPEAEDRSKAEQFFLEREDLSPEAHAKLQTATFYFYVLRDFSKTIEKVNEIGIRPAPRASPSYYSGLALKGQALIELNRIEEAAQVLDEMQTLIQPSDAPLPYGDEINFLERAISDPALEAKSRTVLVSIIPRMRSQEYREKAKQLLG